MKNPIMILVLVTLLLSACDTQEPQAAGTPEPASGPTVETTIASMVEPTEEISELSAEAELLDRGALIAHPWQWISFTSPVEQFDVEMPDRYRVLFNQDGAIEIVADCNNAAGDYTSDAGALAVTIGPSTPADCSPGSLTDPFLTYLGSAARYFFQDGNLFIDLMADGGTMVLAPSDNPSMIAEGEGDLAGGLAVPSIEMLGECFVEMPAGVDFDCGYVTVPEFYRGGSDRTIRLGFVRLLSSAETPAEPLFFASGGPGGSLMNSAPTIASAIIEDDTSTYAQLLSARDLVFFTQRGTLYADPALMCDLDDLDPYLTALGEGSPVTEREQAEVDSFKACYERYVDAGVDFSAYNSVESAADMNSIREALGYDQIVFYGESYGTLLGQHVMRDFPEMLTAVILDGTVPISTPSWVTQLDAKYQFSLTTVIDLCAADEACSAAYPNLAEDVETVYQKLQTQPYTFDMFGVPIPLDENLAAIAFYDSFYSPALAAKLPLTVDSIMNDREEERINDLLSRFFPSVSSLSWLTHYAVICSEDPITSVADATSLDSFSYSVIREFIRSDTFEYSEMCALMDLPVLPDETDIPISSDVPVLLLSGAFDPITPAFTGEEILPTLPNNFSFEFPYGGHVQFLTGNPCAQSIVSAFIADPSAEPDSSCITESAPLPFALTAEEPVETAEASAAQPVFASGKFWQWVNYLDPVNGETAIDDEQTYTFTLTDDGLAVLSGLCLAAIGSYERGDDTLSLTYDLPENIDETCEPGPNEESYFQLMQGAARYYAEDDQLFVELAADGGTLVFDVLEDRSADIEEAVTVLDLCGEDALRLNEIAATLDPGSVAALDELLPTYITEGAAIRPPAPGAALLVITPQGRYFKSVGVSDVTTCDPLPADALFEIGSNTKMMTAAIIYQLQEEGVLSTSDAISQWVPEMAAIIPNGEQITIDMLLTHTSGIYDYINGTGNNGPLYAGATDRDVLTAAYAPEELVELAVDAGEPYFAPGEEGQWMYSNTGYILLGQIIEAATGKTYGENLEERIFRPLGLARTFLAVGQPEPGLLPTGYLGSPFDYTTTEWNLSQGWSAGAVVADAEELAVFLRALFSGTLFRNPETLDLMLSPASPEYPSYSDQFYYGHGMFYKYGLLGHGGQALGYQSDVGYLPEEDVTIVLWTNSAENTAGQAAAAVGEALGIVTTSVMP